MLEQLFGSKTRVRLLRLLLNNASRPFYVRELSRVIGAQINAVRNEINTLLKLDLLVAIDGIPEGAEEEESPRGTRRAMGQRKYVQLNTNCLLYPELAALFQKSQVLLEKDLAKKLAKAGNIVYLALTGYFVGNEESGTDIFIVGKVNRPKLMPIIRAFEKEIGREINFTVMAPEEFRYRQEVTDKFLFNLLESRKIVVVDSLTARHGE